MKRLAHSIVIVLAALLVAPANAQKHSTTARAAPQPNRLVALKAKGTTRYSDNEILAASGLQIGQPVAEGDFKEAVKLLGDSGLFSAVAYSYAFSDAGVRIELQVADLDRAKLVPAHFENFVWFTDGELVAFLQHRVPLFKQFLPPSGTLPDHVTEALQAILSEKHLPGRVDSLPEGDQEGGALHGINYRLEQVSIRIREVEFPGSSPEQAALLAVPARRLRGMVYGRSTVAAAAKFDLLPVFLQHGYLKAAFGPSDARVVPPAVPAEAPERTDLPADLQADLQVDALVPVMPGKVYVASGIGWKGNSAVSTADLAPLLHLPPGQPADAVRLERDLENVGKLYRSRGYMTVQIKSEAQFDEQNSSVHYDLKVVEGDLYRMGELEILGLDAQSTARMRAAWTLHEGQPYNAGYVKQFNQETSPLLPRNLQWNITTHETLDAKDKTVDVEIRYKQQ